MSNEKNTTLVAGDITPEMMAGVSFATNANDVEAKAKLTAVEMYQLALRIGIDEFSLRQPWDAVHEKLDQNDYGSAANDVVEALKSNRYKWIRDGRTLVIDGGSAADRRLVSDKCLFQALVANFDKPGDPMLVAACALLPVLNSFDPSRFEMVEDMKEAHTLCLREVSPLLIVRQTSDASSLLENVFSHRVARRLPTIVTIDCAGGNLQDLSFVGWGSTLQGQIGRICRGNWKACREVRRLKLS